MMKTERLELIDSLGVVFLDKIPEYVDVQLVAVWIHDTASKAACGGQNVRHYPAQAHSRPQRIPLDQPAAQFSSRKCTQETEAHEESAVHVSPDYSQRQKPPQQSCLAIANPVQNEHENSRKQQRHQVRARMPVNCGQVRPQPHQPE